MPNRPKITFVVCTYNRADYLRDSLISLLDTNVPAQRFEILVIDNNSDDDTANVVGSIQEINNNSNSVRYMQETSQGLSHARNRGVREARFPIIIFLDDDIHAPDGFIRHWLDFFEKHPEAQAAGGQIRVQFDDPRPDWMSHFLLPLLGHHYLGNTVRSYPKSKYPFGGNMAFRRQVFDQFGFFDTNLGRKGSQLKASEEKEFFNRLNHEIERYYVPDAMLYHRVNADRLTKAYIRRQALGLGQSIALQLQGQSSAQKVGLWIQELGKLGVSLALFLPYTISLQWSKAVMLLQFRKWIAEGYFSAQNELQKS